MTSPDTEFISILGAPTAGGDTVLPRAGKSLPDTLPILGLSDIVIFPGMVAPLLVESAASIRLIDDVVAGDRFIGLVLQKKPEIENPGQYRPGAGGGIAAVQNWAVRIARPVSARQGRGDPRRHRRFPGSDR